MVIIIDNVVHILSIHSAVFVHNAIFPHVQLAICLDLRERQKD